MKTTEKKPEEHKNGLTLAYQTAGQGPVYDVGWQPKPSTSERNPAWGSGTSRTPYTAVIGIGTVTLKPC